MSEYAIRGYVPRDNGDGVWIPRFGHASVVSSFVDPAPSIGALVSVYDLVRQASRNQESVLFSLLQILITIRPLYRLNARFPLLSECSRSARECWDA